MCRSAVIALYGRTPRRGTAGHVATRRGLDSNQCGRAAAARTSPEDRGQPGGGPVVEPAWTAARRDEAEAWAEHPCHAGGSPGNRRRRVAPKPGSRPLPATAPRSRRFGRQRKERRRASRSHGCGFAGSRKRRRIAHHN